MLFNINFALIWVEFSLDLLVAIAQVDQEDVVSSKNLKATFGDHWNLSRGVLCKI